MQEMTHIPDLSHFGDVGVAVMKLAGELAELKKTDTKSQAKPDFYTVAEVAGILKCSHTSVYRLIDDGCLKVLGGFRHKRISRNSLESYQKQAIV